VADTARRHLGLDETHDQVVHAGADGRR
jgi:hypothetical protein